MDTYRRFLFDTNALAIICSLGLCTCCATLLAKDAVLPIESEFARIRQVHAENADKLFEVLAANREAVPLNRGFALLWLNRELPEANRLIREAQQLVVKEEGGVDAMTREIAGSEALKWQMRTWNRLYQLFNDKSKFHPGRLDRETQAMIEETFWLYACAKSDFRRYGGFPATAISGTENHEIMHYGNALLALQALKSLPSYGDRKLPDGRRAVEHYTAANAHYKIYSEARAKHGLLVEVFSGYGKYTMPELFNMRDFAEDPALRDKMESYLHLIWADWAIGQLNGVRGGGRLRIYQGKLKDRGQPGEIKAEYNWGTREIWQQMSGPFFRGKALEMNGRGHPIAGWPMVLASTGYRVPEVIMDLAADAKGRGTYTYVARRLGRRMPMAVKDIPIASANWHPLDSNDTRMIGYDYCTPDYVMGSLIIDPTLPLVSSRDATRGIDLVEGYPNLTSQNRYHAIIFASDLNARVVPQCEGLRNGKTYGQQQAVQHENVLLVQRHAEARQTGDMRVIWGRKGMRARIVELDGWLILKEGKAWLGVKGFSRTKANTSCGSTWDNDVILRMKDGKAPVAFVGGRTEDFDDLDAFSNYLQGFSGKLEDGWFTLANGNDDEESLALHLESAALPKISDKSIDLRPKMLFDSPFMQSTHGSGIVTIQKGERKLTIDLSAN